MKFILGKKIEMARIFNEKGEAAPVTLIEAGPCFVTQIKEKNKDGYNAVQIGFEKLKKQKIGKSRAIKPYRFLREFRVDESGIRNYETGKEVGVSIFEQGEKVNVVGISKGKGFQGGVKRWGFSGRNATHGVKHEQRTIGSVGAGGPQRVFKGKKMPGRMGAGRITVRNLEVAKVDPENNLCALKGAVPGRRGSLLEITV